MRKSEHGTYDARIRTSEEFFQRYRMIVAHGLSASEIAEQRASGQALGMQELRFGLDPKDKQHRLAKLQAQAEELLASQPPDVDVSLIYSTTKARSGDESVARNERDVAAELADRWYEDAKLQRMVSGVDSAGVEDRRAPIPPLWQFAAKRAFRNAIEVQGHLSADLRTASAESALVDRIARGAQITRMDASGLLVQFRDLPCNDALVDVDVLAIRLRAEDKALSARRSTDRSIPWAPALPALDAHGVVTERFAGVTIEAVARDTRIIIEALNAWSAETGTAHGDVTLLGFTAHAGEQVLSEAMTPMEQLDQVDQAVSMGADRIGHGLILAIDVDLLIQKRPEFAPQREAFLARRREVIARVKANGVVVEANLSSNMEISNLTHDQHPVGRFVDEGIRVTVNTDDETVLDTDIEQELFKVSRAQGVTRADVATMILEAYRSRLGNRELVQRARIKAALFDALTGGLANGERAALATHLADAMRIAPGPSPDETIHRVLDAALGL